MEDKYELVTANKCMDIYRLRYGVLLKVYKCEFKQYLFSFNKRKHTKIDDNLYITKENIQEYSDDELIPKGSYILEGSHVVPINDTKKYRIELKTTGSCFSGQYDEFTELQNIITEILNKYK